MKAKQPELSLISIEDIQAARWTAQFMSIIITALWVTLKLYFQYYDKMGGRIWRNLFVLPYCFFYLCCLDIVQKFQVHQMGLRSLIKTLPVYHSLAAWDVMTKTVQMRLITMIARQTAQIMTIIIIVLWIALK